eukprot:1912380-Rhodomonas_salina.1
MSVCTRAQNGGNTNVFSQPDSARTRKRATTWAVCSLDTHSRRAVYGGTIRAGAAPEIDRPVLDIVSAFQ